MGTEVSEEVKDFLNSVLENLESVLCDPEGKVCIEGTQKDRNTIQVQLFRIASLIGKV